MTTEEDVSGSPAPRRRWWWIAGSVVVVVVVAVVIAIGVATGWGTGTPSSPDGSGPRPSASGSSASTPPPSGSTDDPDADDDAGADPAPAEPRTTAPPIALDETAEPADGIRVTLTSLASITGQASVPGEVAGPALQVSVTVENANADEALTDTLIVNVYYGADRTPANILVRPRQDLPLTIPAGEKAKGVYAFSVPADARDQILVEVDLSVDLPVVLFEGAVS